MIAHICTTLMTYKLRIAPKILKAEFTHKKFTLETAGDWTPIPNVKFEKA